MCADVEREVCAFEYGVFERCMHQRVQGGNVGTDIGKARANGVEIVGVGWNNASYYLDEYQGDLRIVTTRNRFSADVSHHLSVLREGGGGKLLIVATLPNSARPEPIGKPREQIQAVRFFGPRAYVATFRRIDPLYVLDLSIPVDPRIAGELEIPGFATFLEPLGEGTMERDYLWSVGRDVNASGVFGGVKVELFDVRNMARSRSVGAQVFGNAGSFSDALVDPHALTFLTLPDVAQRYRMAVPINVFDATQTPTLNYPGLHLFEVTGIEAGNAELRFQGAIRASGRAVDRSVMHGDSVFYAHGDQVIGRRWSTVTTN